MSDVVAEFVEPLFESPAEPRGALPAGWRALPQLKSDQFVELLQALREHAKSLGSLLPSSTWNAIFSALLDRCEREGQNGKSSEIPAEISKLYEQLRELDLPRHALLTTLTCLADPSAIDAFTRLICADPPLTQQEAVSPFVPLMRSSAIHLEDTLFPKLYDCLAHPSLAALVLDVANFCARQVSDRPHSATDRSRQLIQLLAGVTQQLESIQDGVIDPDEQIGGVVDGERSAESVSQAIALAISLSDTLALIGDESAKAVLRHASQLRHRRIRLEAASALARLGDEEGQETLLALAAEPSLRLRVLRYAEELGVDDQIDEQFSTGAAIAEAEFVIFLASPQQFGVAPSDCELVESTTLYWPGYEEPRECYLFRYRYATLDKDGEMVGVSNLGIAGPLTHTVAADITHLSPSDALALFAGWHAEHRHIAERVIDPDSTLDRTDQALQDALEEGPYEQVQLCLSGIFFDDRVLIAKAVRDGRAGIAVADADGVSWFPQQSETRPLQPGHAFSIYKGRRLLASFNPHD